MEETKAKLGVPMSLNEHKLCSPVLFPLCPSKECWCYNCSMSSTIFTQCDGQNNRCYWEYKEQALKNATKLRDAYVLAHPPKENTNIKVRLGEAMTDNTTRDGSLFPLCRNRKCWCYKCSLFRVESREYLYKTYGNPVYDTDSEWNDDNYKAEALRSAIKYREKYIASLPK